MPPAPASSQGLGSRPAPGIPVTSVGKFDKKLLRARLAGLDE